MADNTSGIKAGRAFVAIGADDTEFTKALKSAQQKLHAFGTAVQDVGVKFFTLGSAIAGPILAAAKIFSGIGDDAAKMAKRTGLSVEAVTSLGFAAQQSGTDVETLETGIRKMQKAVTEAGDGLTTAQAALSELGLSAQQLAGLNTEAQFKAIAEAFNRVSDSGRKSAIAMELFGKSGTQLIPLLSEGAAGISALEKQAASLGITLSAETAVKAERLNDSLNAIEKTIRGGILAVGAAVAPLLSDIADKMAAIVARGSELIRAHADLVVVTLKVGTVIAALGGSLLALGSAAKVTAIAIGGLASTIALIRTVSVGAIAAIQGLYVAMVANPPIALLAVLATAVAAVGVACVIASRFTAQLTDEMAKQREAGDQLRAIDLARISRLQELSQKEKKTADDMKEAAGITAILEKKYGNLGIRLDQTTGQIDNVGAALGRMAVAMREVAAVDLNRNIKEVQANIKSLDEEIRNVLDRQKFNPFTSEETRVQEIKDLVARRDEQYKQLDALTKRRHGLKTGDIGAIAGGANPAATTEANSRQIEERTRLDMEWSRKVHQLKLQQIQDEYAREVALLNEKYDYESQRAKEAGTYPEVLASIEQARTLELDQLKRKLTDRRASEEEKLAQEIEGVKLGFIDNSLQRELAEIDQRFKYEIDAAKKAGDTKRAVMLAAERDITKAVAEHADAQQKLQAAAQGNLTTQQRIEELRLQTQYQGAELEQKMLDLERQRAIQAAKTDGENADLVNQEFDLRQKLLNQKLAGIGGLQSRVSAEGTFNPFAASGLVSGSDHLSKIELNTQRTHEWLARMARKPGVNTTFA